MSAYKWNGKVEVNEHTLIINRKWETPPPPFAPGEREEYKRLHRTSIPFGDGMVRRIYWSFNTGEYAYYIGDESGDRFVVDCLSPYEPHHSERWDRLLEKYNDKFGKVEAK